MASLGQSLASLSEAIIGEWIVDTVASAEATREAGLPDDIVKHVAKTSSGSFIFSPGGKASLRFGGREVSQLYEITMNKDQMTHLWMTDGTGPEYNKHHLKLEQDTMSMKALSRYGDQAEESITFVLILKKRK
jgi:hypothetical protein